MSDNIWQRLADALVNESRPFNYSEVITLVLALRKLAAEDAEREGRDATYTDKRVEMAARLVVRAWAARDSALSSRCHEAVEDADDRVANAEDELRRIVVAAGPEPSGCDEASVSSSSPPVQRATLPPLDPVLVEECLQLFYKHGGGVSSHAGGVSMDAALTHYRERVEGPLRELAEQRREALEYERGETRRAADASAFYQREADRLRAELAEMEKRKDGAYEERNRVVALLAALYPSKRWRTAIEGWSEDWHGCVYIETPEGQLSWHYHDSQESIFDHVPEGNTAWDGHTTEEKYRRVERLCDNAAFSTKPQPTDEERQRLADMARYYGGQGASSLVYVRADDMRRIATLLEEPPRRKSLGRRWVSYDPITNECRSIAIDKAYTESFGYGAVLCDLVPVAEEEKP